MLSNSHFVVLTLLLLVIDNVLSSEVAYFQGNLDDCGQRSALTQQLENSGNQSRLGEWPWHAAVFIRMDRLSPRYVCGGTIITNTYILTAAHCIYLDEKRHRYPSEILIRTGITNLKKQPRSMQQIRVAEFTVHEDYQGAKTSPNDIALLKLAWKLQFTNYVKPICLSRHRVDEELGYTAGWSINQDESLNQLQNVPVPIVSQQECRDSDSRFYTRFLVENKCFCGGFRNETMPVNGFSGGGLYIMHNGRWIVRGIVSKSKLKRNLEIDKSSYIVFIDVAYFLPWVNNNTKIRNAKPSHPIQDYSTCGKKTERHFSRAGIKEKRMWPWQGDVYRDGPNSTWLCQAAVLNENFVLSPAEVYSDREVRDPLRIFIVFEMFKEGKPQVLQQRHIRRIVRHDQFVRESRINNLALLELKVPLMVSELIKPICLWKADPAWQKISNAKGYTGEHQADIYDHNTCVEKFNLEPSVSGNHSFCWTVYGITPILIPDLLYIKHADSWYLRGVSFNMLRADNSEYYIFVLDLAFYSEWIEKNAVVGFNNLLNLEKCNDLQSDSIYQIWSHSLFQCYASLITPKLLLTTASCVEGIPVNDILIRNDADIWDDAVRKVYSHPSFDKMHLTDNIAIVKLKQKQGRTPICLPKSSTSLSNLELKIYFWQFYPTISFTHLLEIRTTETKPCAEKWLHEDVRVFNNGQHICGQSTRFGPYNEHFDCSCNLHGAPLFYDTDDRESYLRGLLDVGRVDYCGGNDFSEVFVDVMFYAKWITTVVMGAEHRTDDATNVPITRNEWRRFEV